MFGAGFSSRRLLKAIKTYSAHIYGRGKHSFQPTSSMAMAPTVSRSAMKQASIDQSSGQLRLVLDDTKSDVCCYHPKWLRFNCQCSQCRQPSSNQRILASNRTPTVLELDTVLVQDQKLIIRWRGHEHIGELNLSWLRSLVDYSELEPVAFQGSKLPHFDANSTTDITVPLYESILRDGFAVVSNLPTSAGTVKTFVENVLRLDVQKTIYGEVFDVISTPNPINVAYSNAELKPHMDLVYYESPPGLQLLHCLRFDDIVQGGDSTFVDGFFVAAELRRRYPEQFRILSTMPATFEKIHFDRERPVYMRYRRPHIALNDNQDVTAVFWAPQFEGPLFAPVDVMSAYYNAYQTFTSLIENSSNYLQFRLKPGEMVVFNNRRLLHGRTGFTNEQGTRHFQGCYVNIDEFKSQAQVARIQQGISPNVPRVANQSF